MTWALLYLFIGTATATYMADKATKEDWYNGESVAWRKQPFSTKVAVMQPDARLRTKAGMNVEVGPHTPPPGGPQIQIALEAMLEHDIKQDPLMAFNRHCRYESLHPFTDGNGRSGRAIWLWMMGGMEEAPLGFLHHFYYQSLQHFRA